VVSSGSTTASLQLTAQATSIAANNGNVFIQDADADPNNGLLPAVALGGSQAGGTGSAANSGTFSLQETNAAGSISLNAAVTAASQIVLSAGANIIEGNGGSLSSPSMNLTATSGSIGASGNGNAIAITNGVSGGISFFATAPSTVSGKGNVFVNSTTLGQV